MNRKRTLKEKVGQLFINGTDGLKINAEAIHLLQSYPPAGIYLTAENMKHPKQVHHLTNRLQQHAGRHSPLFIAIKQHGVLAHSLHQALTPTLSPKEFGELNNRLYTKQMAEITGKELRGMGITLNLAPTLNPGSEPAHFSTDTDIVAKHGRAAIEGYKKSQVIAAAGHFPADANETRLQIHRSHLHAFDYCLRHGGIRAIVTKEAEQTGEFLRKEWQYDGLIIQDFTEKTCTAGAVIAALNNEADLIVLKQAYKRQLAIIDTVYGAVQNGEIPLEKIDEKLERVIHAKEIYQVGKLTPFDRDLFRSNYSLFRSNIVQEAVR